MNLLSLNDDNFNKSVQSGVSIVDFWAIWCGPCRLMTPVVEDIAKEMTDINVYKLNVDDHPELTAKFNIMSIPTVIIFKDGVEVDQTVGVVSKSVLVKKIKNYI
ncbi:MAG: thioredoxin [Candidatus Cloacimonadales bacterium]